jgi:hypothetical protein
MTIATPDVDKLPKWAQRKIEALERKIEALEREVADLRRTLAEGPEDSDTFADPYSDSPRPLGSGTSVQFVIACRDDGSPRTMSKCDSTIGGRADSGSESITSLRRHPTCST